MTTNYEMPRMLKLKDAARETGLSYGYLRRMCLDGALVHIRCGQKILVNMDRLADYLNGAKTGVLKDD